MKFIKFILSVLFALSYCFAFATHNRAGEITYTQIGPLKIRMTVTTYTKASSTGADRDTVPVTWGDGQTEYVARANGPFLKGEILPNDTKKNLYVAEHTYPGVGTYTITMTDPNRVGNILNLNFPNSIGVQFHLSTTFTLLNPNIQGYNNSAILLQPPIDFGCIGKKFVHNVNAYDPDGDSLSYDLIVPYQAINLEVPNYKFPDLIIPGPDNKILLDKTTGNFVWTAPQKEGEYNIAILIKEYRNGILLNSIVRDMQITIENCSNEPPELIIPSDICVIAGNKVEFKVQATDKNSEQKIALSALGGPFNVVVNKAGFLGPTGYQKQVAINTFSWITSCEHISDIPYSVVFRAVDNGKNDSSGLAELRTLRIKVVGPPPQNLKSIANAANNKVRLTWNYPNACAVTVNDYFKGFSIWRKINSNQFPLDTCKPGLAGKGYTKIASNVLSKNIDAYFYEDSMLENGKTHCYRVLAEFALTSPGGYSYNRVASLPSDETCVQLKRDLPFITEATVLNTSTTQGQVEIKWILPVANDLDTIKRPGPYTLKLSRAEGIYDANTVFTPIPGAIFTSTSFANFKDSVFIDQNLNTQDKPYSYQLSFFAGPSTTNVGISSPASTVYMKLIAKDRLINLSWNEQVPWNNSSYEVFRRSGTNAFELIGTAATQNYKDGTVVNNTEYCYKVKSIGTYGIDGLPTPLTNFSQIACISPFDSTPPCRPALVINRDCLLKDNKGSVINELSWSLNATDTCFTDDISSINIYFKKGPNAGSYIQIASIKDLNIHTFRHIPDSGFTGCYLITATDKNKNESARLGETCPANCKLEYELPNSFTPNGDGKNDLFVPRTNSGVIKVKFQVFNRWGELLFQTEDPTLVWDGKDQNQKDISDGVYYYACKVFGFPENSGQVVEDRKGFIEIIH